MFGEICLQSPFTIQCTYHSNAKHSWMLNVSFTFKRIHANQKVTLNISENFSNPKNELKYGKWASFSLFLTKLFSFSCLMWKEFYHTEPKVFFTTMSIQARNGNRSEQKFERIGVNLDLLVCSLPIYSQTFVNSIPINLIHNILDLFVSDMIRNVKIEIQPSITISIII